MELVKNNGGKWLQPIGLAKQFGIGRTTVGRLINEMRALKKYQKSFIDVSYKCKLINVADFTDFMQCRRARS